MLRRVRIVSGAFAASIALFVVSAVPAWAAQSITLTWVRHAQSTANASGIIDTTVPGPGLTALGEQQALAIAQTLAENAHDGIYVSDMIRTSQTAAPYAAISGITPVVLGGFREITAGFLEGQPGSTGLAYDVANLIYSVPPAAWFLGLQALPVIFGETGNNFDARVNDAIATVYASGDVNPVVFSHGATIQTWTLMNVTNPVIESPLPNTGVVVVTGNPEDGWTLQSWNGEAVSPTPDLLTKLFLDFRELIVTPQRSIYNIVQSLPYGAWYTDGTSLATIATAVWDGLVATVSAPIVFVTSVIRDVVETIFPPAASAPSPAAIRTGRITGVTGTIEAASAAPALRSELRRAAKPARDAARTASRARAAASAVARPDDRATATRSAGRGLGRAAA